LNDEEFSTIKELSNNIDSKTLILFWQFTIKTIEELDIVSNQNLSIEMFLMRLIHLSSLKSQNDIFEDKTLIEKNDTSIKKRDEKSITSNLKTETINQIKNISQEKKLKPEIQKETKVQGKISLNSFSELIEICSEKKEIKLKYELEKNVNLVSFEKYRIEISFNDNLDKNFVKDLSLKLFEWTGQRWIITFSKMKGEISIKEKEKKQKDQLFKEVENSDLYKRVLDKFSDVNLIDVTSKKLKD
jgi:DNA polymerase-3 subunit gamma/tau